VLLWCIDTLLDYMDYCGFEYSEVSLNCPVEKSRKLTEARGHYRLFVRIKVSCIIVCVKGLGKLRCVLSIQGKKSWLVCF